VSQVLSCGKISAAHVEFVPKGKGGGRVTFWVNNFIRFSNLRVSRLDGEIQIDFSEAIAAPTSDPLPSFTDEIREEIHAQVAGKIAEHLS